jgi:hypothetical protein
LIHAESDRDLASRAIEAALITKRTAKPAPRMKRWNETVAFDPNHGLPLPVSVETVFEFGTESRSERPVMWTGLQTTVDPQIVRKTYHCFRD